MVALTIRDVPDEVRDELAARAARSGRSLQEYLLSLLIELAARPAAGEVRARPNGRRVSVDDILRARDADRR